MSVLLAVWSLARPGARLSARRLFDAPSAPLLRRLLAASGGAALAYVLAAPNWAMIAPVLAVLLSAVVVISIVLAWGALQRTVQARPTRLLRTMQAVMVLDVLDCIGVLGCSSGTRARRRTRSRRRQGSGPCTWRRAASRPQRRVSCHRNPDRRNYCLTEDSDDSRRARTSSRSSGNSGR